MTINLRLADPDSKIQAEVLREMGYNPEVIEAFSFTPFGYRALKNGKKVEEKWDRSEFDEFEKRVRTKLSRARRGDPVNSPSHYTSGKIEVIDFIEDQGLGFHEGNVVKYVARAGKKDPDKHIQDLEKARWYLDRRIKNLKEAAE